ncbi:MAG: hypothetical protein WAV05_15565 [Anaerolineales bacterium]
MSISYLVVGTHQRQARRQVLAIIYAVHLFHGLVWWKRSISSMQVDIPCWSSEVSSLTTQQSSMG